MAVYFGDTPVKFYLGNTPVKLYLGNTLISGGSTSVDDSALGQMTKEISEDGSTVNVSIPTT